MSDTAPVILVTGAAKRIGAAIAKSLHARGCRVCVHYYQSKSAATDLVAELNHQRPDSAEAICADLTLLENMHPLIEKCTQRWGRLDALVNNASSFYPTAIAQITEEQWSDLMHTNLAAPLFLAQSAQAELKKNNGCVVNISDIHGERPLKNYTLYCCAKAAQNMLTKSLAREFAPHIRVNAVAPGAILWPNDSKMDETLQQKIIERIPLSRLGTPEQIAKAVAFLLFEADYMTGQIIYVDGGRSLQD